MIDIELQAYLEKAANQNALWRKDHLDDMDRWPAESVQYRTARINAAICLGRKQAYEDVLETIRKGTA